MTTNLPITAYHAKYYAHEITKKNPSHSLEKLATTFVDAQIDLNPHQVDAALFAFSNPLSMGAILADEVGLGKTIEAGLIISQNWAELKRIIKLMSKQESNYRTKTVCNSFSTKSNAELKKKVFYFQIDKKCK